MTTPYANYFVIIMGYFRPFYHSMRTEVITLGHSYSLNFIVVYHAIQNTFIYF